MSPGRHDPLVSVVMPAFNAEARIGASLASVLAQSYARIEVIVVDDGSPDATGAVARHVLEAGRLPFQVVRQENRGPSAARNRGWRLAEGDWIQFLDDDDRIAPQKIAVQIEALQIEALRACAAPPAFMVSTWSKVGADARTQARTQERVRPQLDRPVLETLLRPDGFMHVSAGLASRAWLEKVAGFDDRLSYIEDVELQLRLHAAGGRFAEAPSSEPLFFYQVRPGSLSRSDEAAFLEGCLRNADLALDIARARDQLTPSLREVVCDVLAQGVVFYAARDPARSDALIARIGTLDPHYVRKGGLFRVLARVTGWPLAERLAARARALRGALRTSIAGRPMQPRELL
jgi:glycosyltransferase involved in cell wall biosynthesis